jgi:hypothetical protein
VLNGAFVVNYVGFTPWLYPEMEFGWKMTYGLLVSHYPAIIAAFEFEYIGKLFVKPSGMNCKHTCI